MSIDNTVGDTVVSYYSGSYTGLLKRNLVELLCRKTYNSIFFDLLISKNQLASKFKSLYSSSVLTDRLYFRNLFSDVLTSFRILTFLEDRQLHTLPIQSIEHSTESEEYYTLYQGFVVTQKNLSKSVHLEQDISKNEEPHGIKDLFSVTESDEYAKSLKEQVYEANIRTRGLESELNEIEEQCKRLREKKLKIRKELELIHDNISMLNNNIELVDERKNFLQEYDPCKPDSQPVNIKYSNHEHISISNSDPPAEDEIQTHDKLLSDNLKEYFEKFESKNKRARYIPLALKKKLESSGQLSYIESAHNDYILSLDFNHPFGLLVTTADLDNEINLWDLKTNKKVTSLSEHRATVNCTEFLKNHSLLVSASKDATLKVWNIDLATEVSNSSSPFYNKGLSPCLTTLEGHKDSISALTVDDTTVVSGSSDKTLRHWDLSSGKCIQTIDITMAIKNKVSDGLSLDNSITRPDPLIGDIYCNDNALVTGTKDGIIRLWDLRVGRPVGELKGHTNSINSLRFRSNELISGSNDNTSRLWDLRMGSLIELFTYSESVLCSDFDNKRILNAVGQEGLTVFDRTTRDSGKLNLLHPVSTFKLDRNYLVSGSIKGGIESWSC